MTNDPQDGKAAPEDKAHLDFLTGIILVIVSIVAIILSIGYYKKSGVEFYASPGFTPIIIAGALGLMGVILGKQSLKGSSVKQRCGQLAAALPVTLKSKKFFRAVIGLAMFGFYIYGLMRWLPFWLASFIALAGIMIFMADKKDFKTIAMRCLISALAIGGIILLFQVAFSVPMP